MAISLPSTNGIAHAADKRWFRNQDASGQWRTIFSILAPAFSEAIEAGPGRHVTCPVHGGKDDFRVMDDWEKTGAVICTCGAFPSGFKALSWLHHWSDQETRERVAQCLGFDGVNKGFTITRAKEPFPYRDDADKETNNKSQKLNNLWNCSKPDHERIARYFDHRGFSIPIPACCRFCNYTERPDVRGRFHALIVLATAADGSGAGVQRIILSTDHDGKIGDDGAAKPLLSLYKGSFKGAAIRLGEPTDALAIAEGLETAGSIQYATGNAAWALISASYYPAWNPPPGLKQLFIFADRGDAGEKAALGLADRLASATLEVFVLFPPDPATDAWAKEWAGDSGKYPDWNDVLKHLGPGPIRDALGEAIPWTPRPQPATPRHELLVSASTNGSNGDPQGYSTATFQVGDRVRAKDWGNIGTVVETYDDETCDVSFTNPDTGSVYIKKNATTKDIDPLDGNGANKTKLEKVVIETVDTATFLATDYHQRYLVEGVLAEHQNLIIGGRSKTLKTSIVIDLIISLAKGLPFLGIHRIPERVSVAFLCGESGAKTTKETAIRIAESKDDPLNPSHEIFWGFNLPRLSQAAHRDALEEMIVDRGVKVVVIDPLYLALLDADMAGNAGNVFTMGSHLLNLTELAQRTGITLILLHHFRKGFSGGQDREKFPQPELEELSQAGCAEWARSWFLISRRAAYEDGTGEHKLWARAGGSAGHSSLHALTINEGRGDAINGGRRWEVTVEGADQAKESARIAAENERSSKDLKRVLEALEKNPSGLTRSKLRTASGGKMSGDKINLLVSQFPEDGIIEELDVFNGQRFSPGILLVPTTFDAVGRVGLGLDGPSSPGQGLPVGQTGYIEPVPSASTLESAQQIKQELSNPSSPTDDLKCGDCGARSFGEPCDHCDRPTCFSCKKSDHKCANPKSF